MTTQIQTFAELLEKEQVESLHRRGLACEANLKHSQTVIREGKKYTKVDVGNSGKYMIINDTGEIFGIKAYGVIHRGHKYGTLDTIHEWYWGEYHGIKKQDREPYGAVFHKLDKDMQGVCKEATK